MQTAPAIAALLNPFAAPQGDGEGMGVARVSAVGAVQGGLFSETKGGTTGTETEESQFSDALGAVLAATFVTPQPVAATTPRADGEPAAEATSAKSQAAAFNAAPMLINAQASEPVGPTPDQPVPPIPADQTDISLLAKTSTPSLEAAAPAAPDSVASASDQVSQAAAAAQPNAVAASLAVPIEAQATNPAAETPKADIPAPTSTTPSTARPAITTEPVTTSAASPANPVAASSPSPMAATPAAPVGTAAPAPVVMATATPTAQVQAPALQTSAPPVPTPQAAAAQAVAYPATADQTAVAPVSAPQPAAAPVAAMAQAAAVADPAKPAQADAGARSARTKPATTSTETKAVADAADTPRPAEAKPDAIIEAAPDDTLPASLAMAGDEPPPTESEAERPALGAATQSLAEQRGLPATALDAPRASSQTVALFAAQIASKIDGKATRFDVQLDPYGLGKVDVRVEISARGDVSANLTFENPQAASELRGRQGELQAALEQAGFDLSKTSLSFNADGQGGRQSLFDQQQQNQQPVWRGRAFTDLSDTPEAAPAPVQRRAAAGGVDVRI